ncbi:V-type ATP synthase subunit D [Chishuiella sp.]|uniref:V-type ATP synthase subunit D n=1 Tax=Chishuiella sp. TaxID=1969467 RepID=UPI0028AB57CC|nr:hypothetical protein [Chishuiella sp.]
MKEKLYQFIHELLNDKIDYLQKLINDLRSSNNDTKSSMGDKYETSREMIQQEIMHIQKQLNEVIIQKEQFLKIKYIESDSVIIGSYVKTSMGNFYIVCSLGEIDFHDEKIFVISSQTPLAKTILGKKKGDIFEMNNQKITIEEVI